MKLLGFTINDSFSETQEEYLHEKVEIWSGKGKPTSDDKKATEFLLQLRVSEKYSKLFNDKKTVKMTIWSKIAQEIISAGFALNAKDAGKKCYQKFLNLTKQYINFRKNAEKTGMDKKDPPEFYDILHAILGGKHKINIQNIEDSLQLESEDTISNSTEDNIATCNLNSEHYEQNPLQERQNNVDNNLAETQASSSNCKESGESSRVKPKKVKKSVRPEKMEKQDLICIINNIHKENLEQFKSFEDQIKKQNELLAQQTEQRERMLSILGKFCDSKYGKKSRKRHHSSDSES